jgi:hypothetical protein
VLKLGLDAVAAWRPNLWSGIQSGSVTFHVTRTIFRIRAD